MSTFDEWFGRSRFLVILRGVDVDEALLLTQRAWEVGAELVEIPVQNEANLAALEAAASLARTAGRVVGAGTMTSTELVRRAARAGAAFTVAPGLDEEVAAASLEADLPHLPGVATATEVHRALQLGLTWLKAFPAAVLTPAWITAMHGPFPTAKFVATGGITTGNAAEFLAAGARAVSLGGSFAGAPTDDLRALISG